MSPRLTLNCVLSKVAGVATNIAVTSGTFYVCTTKLKTPAAPTAVASYAVGYIAGQTVESLIKR